MSEVEHKHKAGQVEALSRDHGTCSESPRMDQFQPSLSDIAPNAGVGDIAYADNNYCFNGPRPGLLSRLMGPPPKHMGHVAAQAIQVMSLVGLWAFGRGRVGRTIEARGPRHGAPPKTTEKGAERPAKDVDKSAVELDEKLNTILEAEERNLVAKGTFAREIEIIRHVDAWSYANQFSFLSKYSLNGVSTTIFGPSGIIEVSFPRITIGMLRERQQLLIDRYSEVFQVAVP